MRERAVVTQEAAVPPSGLFLPPAPFSPWEALLSRNRGGDLRCTWSFSLLARTSMVLQGFLAMVWDCTGRTRNALLLDPEARSIMGWTESAGTGGLASSWRQLGTATPLSVPHFDQALKRGLLTRASLRAHHWHLPASRSNTQRRPWYAALWIAALVLVL